MQSYSTIVNLNRKNIYYYVTTVKPYRWASYFPRKHESILVAIDLIKADENVHNQNNNLDNLCKHKRQMREFLDVEMINRLRLVGAV